MIRVTSWKNHKKVDDLIRLYKFIRTPPKQWSAGLMFSSLRSKYEKEYYILLKEFSPEEYEKLMESEQKFREEREKSEQEEKARLAENERLGRISWLEAGGRN